MVGRVNSGGDSGHEVTSYPETRDQKPETGTVALGERRRQEESLGRVMGDAEKNRKPEAGS
jgi:hypothetical protein